MNLLLPLLQQIAIVQESFSPSVEQVEDAQQLIAAFTEATEQGKGAFSYKNKMIDMPTVLQMQNRVDLAKAVGMMPSGE
jgi:citrate lyase beta subunit